jgi:N-acetylmuramoyl-L-alanine amidase
LLLLVVQKAAFGAEAQITKVEPYASRDAARVVLYVSEPVHFERAGDDSGQPARRLYIDLPGAAYAGPASFELKGLLQRVRVTPAEGKLRVTLELSEAGQQSVFFLPQPFRVVIDVARSAASGSKEPAAPARSRAPAANHAERVVRRIALDPGHGGSEPGATGPRGIQEKDIVLDIAHRAAPLLARELGISTLLTRDTDERVALEERVAKANAFGAELFL